MRRVRVFVSWSGHKSKQVAERINKLLPSIVPNVDVFYSANIKPGAVWGLELLRAIKRTQYAIICLTRENLDAAWVNFEAGGITMAGKRGLACPLLIDLKPSQLRGPLGLFQAKKFSKRGFLDVCEVLAGMVRMNLDQMRQNFRLAWPQLGKRLKHKKGQSRKR